MIDTEEKGEGEEKLSGHSSSPTFPPTPIFNNNNIIKKKKKTMASNSAPSGVNPPRKPWERAGSSSGPAPFKPPSSGSTSDVVEASGTANPGEIVPISGTANTGAVVPASNQNSVGRPLPTRPWQQNNGSTYGGYGSNLNYNTSYGSGMHGSYGGGLYRNTYGGGMYNNVYSSGYGGMYGGGMYNSGFGGPMGGYGMGIGGPYNQDPNNPNSAPGFWISFLRVMHGIVDFFGKISVLIDQNTQAFHMFMTALLQIFDRSGMLYGEIARFVLRVLGIRRPRKQQLQSAPNGLPMGNEQRLLEGLKTAPENWDGVWGQ